MTNKATARSPVAQFPAQFPIHIVRLTFHRYHPILHEYRPHVGVDLVAKYGQLVKASPMAP